MNWLVGKHVGKIPLDTSNKTKRAMSSKQTLAYGEAGSILKYFLHQLHDNHSFHYTIQLNFEEKITNIFWAVARMIIDYTLFGDVITFDTTYCKKKIG